MFLSSLSLSLTYFSLFTFSSQPNTPLSSKFSMSIKKKFPIIGDMITNNNILEILLTMSLHMTTLREVLSPLEEKKMIYHEVM
jgi:hypothetical protein